MRLPRNLISLTATRNRVAADVRRRILKPRSLERPLSNRLLAGLCCLGLALTACKPGAAEPQKTARPEPTPVVVVAVTNVAWDRTVSIVGTLYPKDEATLGAQVEGAVEQTLVDFGDRVQTNQDLAFIDTGSYEAALEQALGNLAKADATVSN